MKIAMFGHKRIPSREGGIEIVVEELATRMVELGHDVTCYNRRGHHVSGKEFDTQAGDTYKGVHLKNVFTIDKRGLAAMTSSFYAAWKSAWGDYDVVHIHAEGPAAMCFLPKMLGKRVVVTIHGACEIIGTTGEKPVKSRLSENSVFYPNSNTEYRIKKSYSGFLKRFCAMPGALWCTHRAFPCWNFTSFMKYATAGVTYLVQF